jgi:hypothetical protein
MALIRLRFSIIATACKKTAKVYLGKKLFQERYTGEEHPSII